MQKYFQIWFTGLIQGRTLHWKSLFLLVNQTRTLKTLCHYHITSVTTQILQRAFHCNTVNMDVSFWFHLSFSMDLEFPPKNLQYESHAAAAKTHLTGCGDRWCTAVQTLFFFNLCLFHFVFRSGLQILGSDRTMRTVMFFYLFIYFSISLSVSCVSGVLVQSPSCTNCIL